MLGPVTQGSCPNDPERWCGTINPNRPRPIPPSPLALGGHGPNTRSVCAGANVSNPAREEWAVPSRRKVDTYPPDSGCYRAQLRRADLRLPASTGVGTARSRKS